jgi:hypothetical protein
MTQTSKTKRAGSVRGKNGTKAKKTTKPKKASLARRAYEYDHQYGLNPRKS